MKIIARVEPGEKMVNIAHSYKMNYANIDTILKNKYKITNHVQFAVVVISTIILKKHRKVMEMCLHAASASPTQLHADSGES